MNRNYWMFRVSIKWGYRTKFCYDNNLVYCGWNMGLSRDKPEEILKIYPEAKKMAIKFTYINLGDIIIMPVSGGIAIGESKGRELRLDLDWHDTIKIKWLTKGYSRKNLSSNFQSSLKYRGTFLNLNKFKNEIEEIIENKFDSIADIYQNKKQKSYDNSVNKIAEHLNNRENLKFQDREFEYFILHLLELNYAGLTGQINNQKQEAIDGKDLTMTIDYDDFDINIAFNIQVKLHEGEENSNSLFQISKSDDSSPFIKNVLVTTGKINPKLRKQASEMDIILFGSEEIATMIIENFDSIDEKYYSKLNLINTIEKIC